MQYVKRIFFFLLTFSILLIPHSLNAQPKLLGEIDFPNSGAPEAQPHFIEGVLFLHNFEYGDAARAFQRAQESDPDFALAYWGEAMTHNHPIWMRQYRDEAMVVLERLAPTPQARLEKAPTPREKDYLRALETLLGNTDRSAGNSKEERDFLYRDEMRRLHESYPDDHEAASFYGLSILGTAHEGRSFPLYMRAAAVLQKVWDQNRKHPGAAHYLIHSFDDPIHAPLGLPMAQVYGEIAPSAAHAQHMTSHIFVAMGMWDDVVRANEVASEVQNKRRAELGQRPVVCGHYPYWLEYGYLQQGRFEDAAKVMDACFERISDNPRGGELSYFSDMRARYILDTGDWTAAERWAAPDEVQQDQEAYHFIDALAALHRGDLQAASHNHKRLKTITSAEKEKKLVIMDLELQGLLALHDGEDDKALSKLKEAANMEAALPYEFGPPSIVKPSRELLADAYMKLGHHEKAAEAYKKQLELTPLRTASLLGLMRASEKAGQSEEAAEAYERLAKIWKHADAGIPGLDEVKKTADIF